MSSGWTLGGNREPERFECRGSRGEGVGFRVWGLGFRV